VTHAEYLSTLAILTATLEKIALEIRHLQRTEVREAEEPFGGEQRGSSAMPHKRNPVSSEQVCGLARVVRANAGAALENIALWHERDISHSSVERVILRTDDSGRLSARAHDRHCRGDARLPGAHCCGIWTRRAAWFFRASYCKIWWKRAPRVKTRTSGCRTCDGGMGTETNFQQRVAADPRITKFLDRAALEHTFDLKRQLRYVDAIFARVFS